MAYADVVLADAPVQYTPFSERRGATAYAVRGLGVNGACAAGAKLGNPSLLPVGDSGGSCKFDRSATAYVNFGDVLDFPAGAPFSIEAWVMWDGQGTADYRSVAAKFAASPNNGYLLVLPAGGNAPQVRWWVGGVLATLTSGTPLVANRATHVVATYDGTNLRIYQDSVLTAGPTAPGTQQVATVASFYVGTATPNDSPWGGLIDEMAVYGYALSAAQVAAHYRAGVGQPARPSAWSAAVLSEPTLLSFWRLGEGSGNLAIDEEGANPLTYMASPSQREPSPLPDGAGVRLNGSNQYLWSNWNPYVQGSQRTFEGWALRDSQATRDVLIGASATGVGGGSVMLAAEAGSGNAIFWPNTNFGGGTWTGVIPTGLWFHWLLAHDDTTRTAELCINGVSKGVVTLGVSSLYSTNYQLNVGMRSGTSGGITNNEGWLGAIDDYAIYSGLLANRAYDHYLLGLGVEDNLAPAGAPRKFTPVGGLPASQAGSVEVPPSGAVIDLARVIRDGGWTVRNPAAQQALRDTGLFVEAA